MEPNNRWTARVAEGVYTARVNAGGGSFLDTDESNVIVSLRYSF